MPPLQQLTERDFASAELLRTNAAKSINTYFIKFLNLNFVVLVFPNEPSQEKVRRVAVEQVVDGNENVPEQEP